MPGKNKIDIKFIENKRKRTVRFKSRFFFSSLLFLTFDKDALYKRRRGLVKKAHELSVICGVKISLVCTDFENICFTFCNDSRLDVELSSILKKSQRKIRLTKFEPSEVISLSFLFFNYFPSHHFSDFF